MEPPPDVAVEWTALARPVRSLPRLRSYPVQHVAERRRRAAPERAQALPRLTSLMAPRRPQAGARQIISTGNADYTAAKGHLRPGLRQRNRGRPVHRLLFARDQLFALPAFVDAIGDQFV